MKSPVSSQGGFTLVEVLIASAITVASMGLLLSLFAGSLDRMSRVEKQSKRLIVEKEIVTQLSLINPFEQRTGQGVLGGWSYSWQSEPITEFRKVSNYFGSESAPRDVALFSIRVELKKPTAKTVNLEIKRLGWRI